MSSNSSTLASAPRYEAAEREPGSGLLADGPELWPALTRTL